MLIKKLELENIKSHRNSTFEFSKGTTAITGENGAGKTTIIEAIAWALFDVLDYKKDEFLSRGSKKGNVNVTFESGADGRDYVVYRDTGAGYHVYDPQLGLRIAEKRAEVGRFLWEHLGVEPGTDLSSLFKHAIGVPQGTLTAIFLSSPAERKATFDTLLKVEEYRRAADELLRTQRFVESGIAEVRENVARTEGQLQEADEVVARLKAFRKELEDLTAEVARLNSEADKLTASVAEMDRLAAAAAEARSAWEKAQAEKTRCETVLAQKQVELAEAREASTRIDEVREPSAKYEHALGRLTELERERIARDKLTHTLREIETAEARVKADQKHTFERLERIQKAHGEKTRLGPAVAEQDRLEKELDEIRRNHARELAAAERVKELESRRDQLRERYSDNGTALKDAQAAAAGAKVLAQVEARESDIVRRLAAMRAELERDERFQAEIQNGLCPILSERCLNLKEGQTLESFVSSQFETLRAGIVTLESERTATAVQVKAARDAERAAERIASLEQRQSEIAAEGKRVAAELDTAVEAAKKLSAVEGTLKGLEEQLRKLENPRVTLAVLEKEAAGEIEVRESLSTIESNIERLESERRSLVEDLENYKDLDAMWAEAVGIRDSNAEAHRTFLKYQRSAEALNDREKAFGECEATVVRAAAEMAEA
ncbi:MAG TPA: SMC family ATPase, partial [Pyrinomonadaceae bacterium]|nr:SMC family ATPase [Pyrinomonadaceae bacterium]